MCYCTKRTENLGFLPSRPVCDPLTRESHNLLHLLNDGINTYAIYAVAAPRKPLQQCGPKPPSSGSLCEMAEVGLHFGKWV